MFFVGIKTADCLDCIKKTAIVRGLFNCCCVSFLCAFDVISRFGIYANYIALFDEHRDLNFSAGF